MFISFGMFIYLFCQTSKQIALFFGSSICLWLFKSQSGPSPSRWCLLVIGTRVFFCFVQQYGQQAYPQSHQYPSAFPGQPQPNSHAMGTGAKAGLLGGLGAAIGTAVMGRSMLNPLHGNRPSYPSVSPFPGQPGPLGTAGVGAGAGLLGGLGGLMGAAAVGKAILNPKKAMKQQRKAQKKALKYGLPIAGAAGGAYLLHKGVKHASHGFHFGSSSSSSSSSSSEEEWRVRPCYIQYNNQISSICWGWAVILHYVLHSAFQYL